MPPQDIEIYLLFLASKCTPPFPEKEARAKIESALKRAGESKINIAQEVRDLVLSTNGLITSTFTYQCLHLTTRVAKKTANQALSRLTKQGLIEKVPDLVATFRVVDNECEELDFLSASVAEYPLKLPFGIEKYVKIMPGNIIVIAGEVNVGKTAYCLNVAPMNMNHLPVHCFSSEMGAAELKERLSKSDLPLTDWKKMKVWKRADQFHDAIKPDSLNIVDYLEEPEEPYKVTARIMQIHKKLRKSIVLIALQKPKGREEAVGGRGTFEKPRLYITLNLPNMALQSRLELEDNLPFRSRFLGCRARHCENQADNIHCPPHRL